MTIEMPLTKGKTTLIDECDADLFNGYKWSVKGSFKGDIVANKHRSRDNIYAYRYPMINGKKTVVLLHKVIMERKLGHPIPEGYLVDHRNRNSLDNQRANLRLSTHSQNMQNSEQSGRSTSPYKGVSFKQHRQKNGKGRWIARIAIEGQRVELGRFATAEEAARAYNEAALLYFGEYAHINDIAS